MFCVCSEWVRWLRVVDRDADLNEVMGDLVRIRQGRGSSRARIDWSFTNNARAACLRLNIM
jgi:hypothetical protein